MERVGFQSESCGGAADGRRVAHGGLSARMVAEMSDPSAEVSARPGGVGSEAPAPWGAGRALPGLATGRNIDKATT